MEQKVYVLESGEYSDKQVEGVFSSIEDAMRVNEKLFGNECSVLTFTLNKLAEKEAQGLRFFYVELPLVEGRETKVWEGNPELPYMYDAPDKNPHFDSISIKPACIYLMMCFWAKDKEEALKIAMERRAKYLETYGKVGGMGYKVEWGER